MIDSIALINSNKPSHNYNKGERFNIILNIIKGKV